MDRFVIADNPMSGKEQIILVHTVKPVTLIECIPGHVQCKTHFVLFEQLDFVNCNHKWTLRVHYTETKDIEQLDKLLNRAWHWYFKYMEKLRGWEKENDYREPYYFVKRPSK